MPSVCWKSEIIEFLKGRVVDSGETVESHPVSLELISVKKIVQMSEIDYVRTVT